jgi:hypothetical protein
MAHKSRIDWCVLASIALAIGAAALRATCWIAGPVLLVLLLWAYPQTYKTTDQGLVVRDALTRRLIPYEQITWAGPGASRVLRPGRLRLQYGMGSELDLAPADREGLLADLAARAPHLARRGNQLVRKDRHVEYCFERAGGFRIGMGRG